MRARLLLVALLIILPLGFVPAAQAVPTLTLSDGLGSTMSVADGSALDVNPAAGQITVVGGTVGQFTFSSFSATYSLTSTTLTMNWSGNGVISMEGAGTLFVAFGESGIAGLGWLNSGTFSTSGTQTVAGLVSGTSTASYNGANILAGPLLFDTRPNDLAWGTGQLFALGTGPITDATITATLNFWKAGSAEPTGSLTASVPEPGTLLFLGFGLACTGLFRIFRKKA